MTEKRYNVCICTYMRAEALRRCLKALAEQVADTSNRVFELTVIDNDANQSAKANVLEFKSDLFQEVRYECEPERGIPHARNKAIEISLNANSDFLIFIDDDEEPKESWLENLCSYNERRDGQEIIHGRVVRTLPEDAPAQLGPLFQKQDHKSTGTLLDICSTDNVLIPHSVFGGSALRFQTVLPLAGGTDTLFFAEAQNKGYTIRRCKEAEVIEHIPSSRLSLRWLIKRKFRVGITESIRKRSSGKSPLYIFSSSISQMLVYSVASLYNTIILDPLERNRYVLKICRAAGFIYGLFGMNVKCYNTIER